MKITRFVFVAVVFVTAACSGMKTRKEAAEEAKLKAESAEQGNAPAGPIDEDIPDGVAAGAPKPAEDQVLDDELAAMGIDPSNPDGIKHGTPEPEVDASAPAATPTPVMSPVPVKKAAAKKSAKKSKKPAPKKKTKKKPAAK